MTRNNPKEIAHELLKGKGYYIIENLFSKKDINKTKEKLIDLAKIKSPNIIY